MRGKLEVKEFKSTATRIIPAHAGQTSTLGMTVVRPSDHPRACGANDDFLVQLGAMVGSSPRMRGKRRLPQQILRRLRIIPAHAGQTRPGTRPASRWSDHPRACGANVAVPVTLIMVPGSSPRMRGKHMHMDMSSIAARIIPAHAGQTAPVCNPNRPPPDHPRACGANEVIYERLSQLIGSSPRMRGKPTCLTVGPSNRRIIPAHAGQTLVALAYI